MKNGGWIMTNTSIVSALVPEDDDFGARDDDLLGGDCGSCAAEPMQDAVDVLKVFPDEFADAGVLWNGLIITVVGLVTSCRSFDGSVVHECAGDVGDLRGKDEGDVVMEYGYCVSPTLWEASQSHSANGGLNGREIA